MNLINKIAIGSISSVMGNLVLSELIEKEMANYNSDVLKPIDSVSIIMPSYNEESMIELAVWSIRNQSIINLYPEYFEFILVDSHSTDKSIELASPYVDKIVLSSKGKLTARNIATQNTKGNIIVSVDADTYYPYHWLNTLLEPFNDLSHKSIIGVVGSTFDYGTPVPGRLYSIANLIDKKIINRTKITARNSAYYKHAFYLVGTFNDNINQLNGKKLQKEEEYDFGHRLSTLGKIIFKLNASCIHLGGRRAGCRIRLGDKQSCEEYQFGIDRF